MKIVNLMDNLAGAAGCLCEHGLSYYIETKNHKLLMDTGASAQFLENAKMLGIDLTAVDTVFLSHGHYDHAGGILPFAGVNKTAKIYLQKGAVKEYYSVKLGQEKYIGINPDIRNLPQIEWIDGDKKLDEELEVFSNVTGRKLWPKDNLTLKRKEAEGYVQDEFDHEQYLVISCVGKKILVSGCAHNGILNILDAYRSRYGGDPDVIISGFHMMKRTGYDETDIALIRETAETFAKTDIKLYTGHCTSEPAYLIMKEILGSQIVWVHSGDCITFEQY